MTLMIVPEDSSPLDVLAGRYRAAFDKTKAGREQWIEGTLELAAVIAEARNRLLDHREYGRWIKQHGLHEFDKDNLAALSSMGRTDPMAVRKVLEDTSKATYRYIWKDRPDKPQQTPRFLAKGPQQTFSRTSGSSKRKRAQRIPDVMREDYDPPPVRKAVVLKAIPREQIDPDFKGTSTEFATKHGHVTLHTKAEIKHHKHQEALSAWLGAMADHERSGREMLAALDAVDPETLREWLAKPGKAAKLQAWCKSITLACEKLRDINK